jgi:uncharacterized protein with HEPN domain
MSKDEAVLLDHIQEAILKIEEYTESLSKEEFLDDERTQDAVIRRLEIIGEASKNLSSKVEDEKFDEIWEGAAEMRDVLIHQYFGVDLEIVWNTVTQSIPELKENINEINKNKEQTK